MQEHHTIFLNAENHAGDSTVRQAASDFPQLAAERAYQRHTNRPRKLDILDVFTDDPSILCVQALKAIPAPAPARYRNDKTATAIALERVRSLASVPIMIHQVKELAARPTGSWIGYPFTSFWRKFEWATVVYYCPNNL